MDQFRLFGLRDSSEPFYSLTYAIAPILKPWYWWGYPVLDMHWYWDQQRSSLHDSWTASFLLRWVLSRGVTRSLASILAAVYANSLFVKQLLDRRKKALSCGLLARFQSCVCSARLTPSRWFLGYALSCGVALLPLLLAFKTMLYVVPTSHSPRGVTPRLMPAHLALPLSVVYLFAWQWVAAAYLKLLRAFSPALLRSLNVPRYWYWCAFWCVVLYFGLTFYMDCFCKIFAAFTFVYYLLKVTAIEGIKAFEERK